MKNVSCWREPTATKTDHQERDCIHCCRQKKFIDDLSTVWLSIQGMVAVQQEHVRTSSTPANLLAVRLELQRLSLPQHFDTNVDEEVSQLLCRPPSPQLPQTAGRQQTNRRATGRDNAQEVPARWAKQGTKRSRTSLCRLQRHRNNFKRPCLDFDKMQASH